MKVTRKNPIQAGFSLVEMLVVIAVIGIIAAIAIPNIGQINETAENSKNQRNAQNLASVCASASAAGLDFINGRAEAAKGAVIADIVTGDTPDDGPFDGTFFGVPGLTAEEQTDALPFLLIEDGVLKYDAEGGN